MQERIGKLAGKVYHYLEQADEPSVSKVTREVEGSGTKIYMAIGWLAKEGKLEFIENGRGTSVRLR